MDLLKMFYLLKMGILHCHVSLLECTYNWFLTPHLKGGNFLPLILPHLVTQTPRESYISPWSETDMYFRVMHFPTKFWSWTKQLNFATGPKTKLLFCFDVWWTCRLEILWTNWIVASTKMGWSMNCFWNFLKDWPLFQEHTHLAASLLPILGKRKHPKM